MKRCMMMVFITVMVFLSMLPEKAMARDKLFVDKARLDFGTMKEGLVAEKIVTLTNAGDSVITIKNVSTS